MQRNGGSIALMVLAGGGLAMLIALVLLITVADLVITRSQAQLAADAAALAAMGAAVDPASGPLARIPAADQRSDGSGTAAAVAEANGGELMECCGDDPLRRDVVVAVEPRSVLLRPVVPRVRASAAAALEAFTPSVMDPGAVAGSAPITGSAAISGDRIWPVEGRVSSEFGVRTHPLSGTQRLHAGIDIAAATGTPIRAGAPGRVAMAGWQGGYGYAVDLRHPDGTVTRYAHQSRLLVRPGQQVATGQIIGLVGSTGASTGPHLHFEVRTGSGRVNPRTWLPP
jgi:murein DD-endopeptidase MepM/ murein hydrolase activator NlpD